MAKANKHLTHLEDRIIIDGSKGGKESIKLLKAMGEFLYGKKKAGVSLTTKWDGAPAVVAGVDPEDGRFFVGTKSVFAAQPKLMKTEAEIQKEYSGALAQKLSACLRYLPSCIKSGVLQGDLMFTNDKKIENIDGKRFITFRPNTITYAAAPDTKLGRAIRAAKVGIVFHTKYTGNSIKTLKASFRLSKTDYQPSVDVWAEKAEFQDITGVAAFSPQEKRQYDAYIRRAEGSLKKAGTMLNRINTGGKTLEFDTEFLKFFNNYVKAGMAVPSVQRAFDDYIRHISQEFDKSINKLKTDTAINTKNKKWAGQTLFLLRYKEDFKFIIASYMNLQAAKHMLVDKLKRVSSLNLFVDRGNGDYVATTPEGFVAIQGDKATKLIDRMEFSKLNFTIPKKWDK